VSSTPEVLPAPVDPVATATAAALRDALALLPEDVRREIQRAVDIIQELDREDEPLSLTVSVGRSFDMETGQPFPWAVSLGTSFTRGGRGSTLLAAASALCAKVEKELATALKEMSTDARELLQRVDHITDRRVRLARLLPSTASGNT